MKTKSQKDHEKQCNIELNCFVVKLNTAVAQILVLVLPNVIRDKYQQILPLLDYIGKENLHSRTCKTFKHKETARGDPKTGEEHAGSDRH